MPGSSQAQRLDAQALRFGVFNCLAVLVAHSLVYLLHEYSHAIVAWLLGWKSAPFAIDYGGPTVLNILFQGDVGDGVDYQPIFAAGRGIEAALIAMAGLVLGNALPYLAVCRLMRMEAVRGRRLLLASLYWIALMCAGNVWSYVPTRALTTHADIALAAQGLGLTPPQLFPFVLAPALWIVAHFFLVSYRRQVDRITRSDPVDLACIVALSACWFFAYFGSAGYDGGYGPISQGFALVSRCLLFPLSAMWMCSASGQARSGPRVE